MENNMELSHVYWQHSQQVNNQPVFPQQDSHNQQPYQLTPQPAHNHHHQRADNSLFPSTAPAYSLHGGFNFHHQSFDIFYSLGMPKRRSSEDLDTIPKRPAERQLMRPWLIDRIDSGVIKGLEWVDRHQLIFRVPWKHGSRHGYSKDNDACLFKMWAIHTGKFRECLDSPNPKRWKANFRCALNSLPDVKEQIGMTRKKGQDAYRVYKFEAERIKSKRVGNRRPQVSVPNLRPRRNLAPNIRLYQQPMLNDDIKCRSLSFSSTQSETSSNYDEEEACQSPKSTDSAEADTKLPTIADWFSDHVQGDVTDAEMNSDIEVPVDVDSSEEDHSYPGTSRADADDTELGRQKLLGSGGGVVGSGLTEVELPNQCTSGSTSPHNYAHYPSMTQFPEYQPGKQINDYAKDDEFDQIVNDIMNEGVTTSGGNENNGSSNLTDISQSSANNFSWTPDTSVANVMTMLELLQGSGTTDGNIAATDIKTPFPIPRPNLALRVSLDVEFGQEYPAIQAASFT